MKPENDKQYFKISKLSLLAFLFLLAAVLLGWWLGRSYTSPSVSEPNDHSQDSIGSGNTAGPAVESLVTYRLPDGWKEGACPKAAGSVFVQPTGAKAIDCNTSPSSPVKLSVDAANSKDCNDLQNVQNVRKHICISLFINGKKSLKAETIYNADSSYKKETSINAYYIDTGKGVLKVEYVHAPNDNQYQAGLDELASSMQVK